ncbi:MAG: SDR family NAD(P)-dependent oxidoreductase [Pseudomonadales bacterium]
MSRTFGAESTCDDVLAGVDVAGKHALVTGASGGLGAEAARSLAAKGVHVTLVARDKEKTEGVAASIRDAHPSAQVDIGLMDLSDPSSVNAFAERWLSEHSQLDMLILNAGLMASPLMRNAQGWEMQFATNHLGHFALTSKLMPILLQSAPARVVSLSSAGHAVSPVLLDDPNFEQSDYDPWAAYGQAKTANIWFATELNRRYAEQGVNATALHPGVISTDLARHLTKETLAPILARMSERGEASKTIPQGAATSIYAATAPELEGKGGLYLADCQVVDENSAQHIQYVPHAFDEEGEARLWAMSEQLLGITFGA